MRYADFEEAEALGEQAVHECNDRELALLGCNDRYFLLRALISRRDIARPWLYERCREVENETDDMLDLWAREHYKSTIITFGGIIQEMLIDPEITVGIFAFNKSLATAFVRQIREELEHNYTLKRLYPDVLWDSPRAQAPIWRDSAILVRRQANPKEATVEAHGLTQGMPTGRHFRLRVYDDVVTDRSVRNPEQVKRTTEAWELSNNLGAQEQRQWHIGTRYSFGDTYGVILERGILKPRIYPATHNGKKDGEPVLLDPKVWEKKKRAQSSTLAAQMLQNPLSGSAQMFHPEWFRPYLARPLTMNVYIMVDPSLGRGASSDRTAMAVVGVDAQGNKYFLDGYRHRMKLSDRWSFMKNLYQKWTRAPGVLLVRVGYERYGQQADDEYFKERMRHEKVFFSLTELNWTREGNQSKRARVERLEPDFRDGRFFLPGLVWAQNLAGMSEGRPPGVKDPTAGLWSIDKERSHVDIRPLFGELKSHRHLAETGQAFRIVKPIVRRDEEGKLYDVTRALMEEMAFFPYATHDDLVDCCSRIYDMDAVEPSITESPAHLEAALEFFVDS